MIDNISLLNEKIYKMNYKTFSRKREIKIYFEEMNYNFIIKFLFIIFLSITLTMIIKKIHYNQYHINIGIPVLTIIFKESK